MKLNDIQNEGIGDSLKTAGRAAAGLSGQVASAVGGKLASAGGVLASGFGRAVGFDASQNWAANHQKGMARQKFIGTFVSKIQGFLASTEEAYKDDIALIQKKQAEARAAQQAQAQGQPVKESFDYQMKLRVALKEDQEVDNFIKQYAGTIEQAITSYMSGNLGNLATTVKSTSQQIAQMILNKQNPVNLIQQLGGQIFDHYYSTQRKDFVQSHPAADIPLSSDGEQVLAALKKLNKKEQDIVIQKLKQGGNLF
jgi:hypothetical protein